MAGGEREKMSQATSRAKVSWQREQLIRCAKCRAGSGVRRGCGWTLHLAMWGHWLLGKGLLWRSGGRKPE